MLTRLLVVSVLLAGACKKDDAKPAPSATTTEPTPAGSATPVPAAPSAPAPAVGGLDATTYQAKAGRFMQDFTNAFASAGTNCDKLATNVNKFIDDNKPLILEMKAYEKAHPDAKTALDDKMQVEYKKQQETMLPVLQACAEKKTVQDALARFDEFE